MKFFRLALFCVVFFFVKESAIAQPEFLVKNSFKADSVENADSTRRARSREFWSHYFPAISVSAGLHSNMISREDKPAFTIGPVWNAVVNIPFDRSHIVNWEGSFHMSYGKDSLGNVISTYGVSAIGMRFYFTDRDAVFRPFYNFAVADVGWLTFKFNAGAGLDYSLNSEVRAQFSILRHYSFRNETFGNGTFAIPYSSYAAFIGLRYQL